jgi:hypothetical protein
VRDHQKLAACYQASSAPLAARLSKTLTRLGLLFDRR